VRQIAIDDQLVFPGVDSWRAWETLPHLLEVRTVKHSSKRRIAYRSVPEIGLGDDPIKILRNFPETHVLDLDSRKARRELGWQPAWTLPVR